MELQIVFVTQTQILCTIDTIELPRRLSIRSKSLGSLVGQNTTLKGTTDCVVNSEVIAGTNHDKDRASDTDVLLQKRDL